MSNDKRFDDYFLFNIKSQFYVVSGRSVDLLALVIIYNTQVIHLLRNN